VENGAFNLDETRRKIRSGNDTIAAKCLKFEETEQKKLIKDARCCVYTFEIPEEAKLQTSPEGGAFRLPDDPLGFERVGSWKCLIIEGEILCVLI